MSAIVTEMHLAEAEVQIFSNRFGSANSRFFYDFERIRVYAKNPETLLQWYFAIRKKNLENEKIEQIME